MRLAFGHLRSFCTFLKKQTCTEIGGLLIDDVLKNEQLSGVGGEDGDGVWRVVL